MTIQTGYNFDDLEQAKFLTLMNIVTREASDKAKVSALIMAGDAFDAEANEREQQCQNEEMEQMKRDNFFPSDLVIDGVDWRKQPTLSDYITDNVTQEQREIYKHAPRFSRH